MSYKRERGFNKIAFIYINIITLFSVLGIGYGIWRSDVNLQTYISTGKINPVFSKYEISESNFYGKKLKSINLTKVAFDENKKKLNIFIDGADKGYCVDIRYTLTNEGSIPVYCDFEEQSNENPQTNTQLLEGALPKPVEITIKAPEAILNGYGDSRDGTITIKVYESKKAGSYNFTIDFKFKQYNYIREELLKS